ncbi:MAG: T9SS type A sorting domain-containing protein, partial [Bacteroidetes bacterium]|nr:T9SS type A sorting domain-containing protein [Bacteroidota bacterium]
NDLTGNIPAELGNLSQLQLLLLNDNQLTGSLPRTFVQLQSLTSLDFQENNGLCAPSDHEFQGWLRLVRNWSGDICESNVSIEQSSFLPMDFVLHGNYPNPFKESTTLQFDLPYSSNIDVDIVDVTGRVVYELSPVSIQAGWEREIPLRNLSIPPGMYLYRLTVDDYVGKVMHTRSFIKVR